MANILKWLEKRFRLAKPSGLDYYSTLAVYPSKAGVTITEDSALRITAVWACVRLIAETVASLPLFVYRRLTRGKERAVDHPLYSLLHLAPNPEMTAYQFKELLQAHLLTWGNCYAEIDYGPDGYGTGYPIALWPLLPSNMQVIRQDGRLRYIYILPDGLQVELPDYRVLHIAGLGYDGVIGYSSIRMAREAIGLAAATEEFGAKFFSEGTVFGGFLEHPERMSAEAQERFLKVVEQRHKGLDRAHRLMILEEGMKYHPAGIPPEDAQFLETRKFQVIEIARFFHVPPHMIGDLERATFSNIEHQSIEFVVYSIRPWLIRWEQALTLKLLGEAERREYFIEFLIDGLLRGDAESRARFYNQLFQVGAISPNEIREKENLNPVEGGDTYYVPLNMMPIIQQELVLQEMRHRAPAAPNYGLLRLRVAKSYSSVFQDAVTDIVRREKQNVIEAAKNILGKRSFELWQNWLEDFYREFGRDYISRKIRAAVVALAKAIQDIACEEVNATPQNLDDLTDKYVDAFTFRYAKSSKGQLKQLAEDAIKNGSDPIEDIAERLDEWADKRPEKVARNEVIQLSCAVAKWVFVGAGIQYLIWHNASGKPCPLCQELDGQKVGIEREFLGKDAMLSVEGKTDMYIYRPVTHPPLHEGCECTILPG